MSLVDPATVARLRDMLAIVSELAARRQAALQADAAPGSLADHDLALDGGRFVTIFAGQTLNDAIDDLNAWQLLVHGPELPMRAHLVLLRAALEASARARWLVDPSADVGTRVGRAWSMRRQDQVERRKFEASLPDRGAKLRASMGPKGKTGAERVAELDDPEAVVAREAAGIRTEHFDGPTELFRRHQLEHIYRLLSGMVHGFEYTLAVMQRTPIEGMKPARGMNAGTFAMSEPVALAMTDLTVSAVRIAVEELEHYRLG